MKDEFKAQQLESFEKQVADAFERNDAETIRAIVNDEKFDELRTERAIAEAIAEIDGVFKEEGNSQTAIRAYLQATPGALKILADHQTAVVQVAAARHATLEERVTGLYRRAERSAIEAFSIGRDLRTRRLRWVAGPDLALQRQQRDRRAKVSAWRHLGMDARFEVRQERPMSDCLDTPERREAEENLRQRLTRTFSQLPLIPDATISNVDRAEERQRQYG